MNGRTDERKNYRLQQLKRKTTRHSMIDCLERVKIQRSSIPKIRKIHTAAFGSYRSKTLETANFGQKMGKFSS